MKELFLILNAGVLFAFGFILALWVCRPAATPTTQVIFHQSPEEADCYGFYAV